MDPKSTRDQPCPQDLPCCRHPRVYLSIGTRMQPPGPSPAWRMPRVTLHSEHKVAVQGHTESDVEQDDRQWLADVSVEQTKEQWRDVIHGVVAACRGDPGADDNVRMALRKLAEDEDWQPLAGVLDRILDGERDADALLDELDPTGRFVAGNVLVRLGVELPEPNGDENGANDGDGDQDVTSLSLVDVVALVVISLHPEASEQDTKTARALTEALAFGADTPEELKPLGRVLHALVLGTEPLDLSGLPDDVATLVSGMLASLLSPRRTSGGEA
jgi:hypothetical protein